MYGYEEYDFDSVQDAVRYLAKQERMYYAEGAIEIPVHIIRIFQEKYASGLSDQELYMIYIDAFCITITGDHSSGNAQGQDYRNN